jgi:hypothetical protein
MYKHKSKHIMADGQLNIPNIGIFAPDTRFLKAVILLCPYVRQRTDNNLFDLVDFVGSIWSLAKTGVSGQMGNPGCIQIFINNKNLRETHHDQNIQKQTLLRLAARRA